MDVFGIVYIIENAQQFWSELEDILQLPEHASLAQLDATLARFVRFCTSYHEQYLQTPVQLEHACSLLLQSELFAFHSERMRERLLDDAEKTTDPHEQLILYKVLLLYGRHHPSFLRSQKKWQPLLPLLMDHILLEFDSEVEDNYAGSVSSAGWSKSMAVHIEARLRLLSVGILYEVCRVQKFTVSDLRLFDDTFVDHLFDLVEQTRCMQDETLNYSVIKLIVALNEQFMVASLQTSSPAPGHTHHHRNSSTSTPEESNRVLRVLMRRLNLSKTFGENMIFMLNRAGRTPEDLCMQLLVLKILYLLFTTKGSSEYFYTNDLCVLVDVFLRELVDLDEESESLRHTYLRVLHPLLTRTQLRERPYKRPQIVRTLESLISHAGIRDVDSTTKRLVERCLAGDWCVQLRKIDSPGSDSSVPSFFENARDRVSSPGADSIAATSKGTFILSSPEDTRSPQGPKARAKTLKPSRSVEQLRPPHVKNKSHLDVGANGKPTNGSALSLVDVTASVPALAATHKFPSPPSSPTYGKKLRGMSLDEQNASSSSSLPSTSSLDKLAAAKHSVSTSGSRGNNSLGQVVDSIVAPTPLQTSRNPHLSTSSVKKGTHHRSAPPTPPKRRKPPAVPVQTSGGATIMTIASSRSTPSPLSRVPPMMPS